MELTRRDATIALAAIGAGGIALGTHQIRDRSSAESGLSDDEITTINATMISIAKVIYPSALTGISTFVATYLDGRLNDHTHARNTAEIVTEINELATQWHDHHVPELSHQTRNRFLDETGAATADENPTGTTAERVRYYIINELQLALYTSPTGGKLVGIENPIGYSGGLQSYQEATMKPD